MTRAWLALPLLLAIGSACAWAQTPPAAPAKPPAQKDPADVVVTAALEPKVTATFPIEGAKTPGGVVVLKVVFDQTMTAEAWSYSAVGDSPFPHCLAKPRLLPDKHSFALLCSVSTNSAYAVQINGSPDFVSARGKAARPLLLHFSTTDTAIYDMSAALKQAGLTDADEPIMTWNAQPASISRSPPPQPIKASTP